MMKQKLTTLMILLGGMVLNTSIFAQAPESFNYQAVVRNNGALITNSSITVEAKLRRGAANGTYVYQEAHTTTTDDYGMFSIEVGEGTPSQGTLAGVDWSDGPYYLQIRANFGGNTIDFGASKLQSVPYALFSGNSSPWLSGSGGINYLGGVGIGTTANIGAKLVIRDNMGLQDNSGEAFGIKINSDGQLSFHPNSVTSSGTASLVLDDDSRHVGVGTSAPDERLHVVGGGVKVDQTTGTPNPATMYGNSLPLAYGYVDGGTMLTDYGVQSFTNPSQGEYAIVIDNNFAGAPVVLSTSFNGNPKNELITYSFTAPNTILIHINQDTGPGNSNFSFVVFGTAQ